MSSVDGESLRPMLPPATVPPETKPAAGTVETGAVASAVAGSVRLAPAAPVPNAGLEVSPGDGLAALLAQARTAQAQLAEQPLPITNHNSRLIIKLFGG